MRRFFRNGPTPRVARRRGPGGCRSGAWPLPRGRATIRRRSFAVFPYRQISIAFHLLRPVRFADHAKNSVDPASSEFAAQVPEILLFALRRHPHFRQRNAIFTVIRGRRAPPLGASLPPPRGPRGTFPRPPPRTRPPPR